MNETSKLREAEYFLKQMQAGVNNFQDFIFNLSAFLSAARSVLQYANEEVKTKSGGLAWYKSIVSGRQVLRFFKDKRDVNIHQQPVTLNTRTTATMTGVARISSSLKVTVSDSNGKIIAEHNSTSGQAEPISNPPPEIQHKYVFPDWTGPEDVITLCQNYITDLQFVINDGQGKGFLPL